MGSSQKVRIEFVDNENICMCGRVFLLTSLETRHVVKSSGYYISDTYTITWLYLLDKFISNNYQTYSKSTFQFQKVWLQFCSERYGVCLFCWFNAVLLDPLVLPQHHNTDSVMDDDPPGNRICCGVRLVSRQEEEEEEHLRVVAQTEPL